MRCRPGSPRTRGISALCRRFRAWPRGNAWRGCRALVINAEEELFEMNNGCICCTVRGDLIRILGTL